jgi:DNA-binding FadR family transcriptional regulator
LAVSRTSVREGIIALEIRGIIEVKSGSGINALHARDPVMAKTQMKMHIERAIREFGKSW